MGLDLQHVAQPGFEFHGIDGLAQKLGRTQPQRFEFRLLVGRGGQDQYRQVGELLVGAKLLENLQAADVRHHDVQQHHVGKRLADQVESPGGIGAS